MDSGQNPIVSAIAAGIIKLSFEEIDEESQWTSLRRIKLFCDAANGKVTMFLGSAISSFKPTQLPMWNQFIELIWKSILRVGFQDLSSPEGNVITF